MKKTMEEHSRGELKSGSGKKAKSKKQALVIAMSKEGDHEYR